MELRPSDCVLIAHGGGGRKSRDLVRRLFAVAFDDPALLALDDAAVVDGAQRLAITTDTYVVTPLEFPGGDIGRLAVFGTVNDLAMVGARPEYMTVGFVLEEGFELASLWRVVCSAREAAREAGVRIVAGDTKVVERGRADGVYLNTTGVGFMSDVTVEGPPEPGDVVLCSGDIGRHGIAVMSARGSLGFASPIQSDCAALHGPALDLIERGVRVRAMRDLTRGGLASVLVELSSDAGVEIEIEEAAVAVDDGVRGACELLGLDPMYVANEGRFAAIVAAEDAELALEILRRHEPSRNAAKIGVVTDAEHSRVVARTSLGSRRLVEMLSGEQLPRIC